MSTRKGSSGSASNPEPKPWHRNTPGHRNRCNRHKADNSQGQLQRVPNQTSVEKKGLGNETKKMKGQRNWYVIRTKTGSEHRATQNLLNQEIETFLPLYQGYALRNGRREPIIRPLFPNYLFAKFSPDLDYGRVRWTRGISRVLGNREGPVSICEKIVEMIRERVGPDNLVELKDEINQGDLVQVTRGPLKELVGIFQKRMSGRDRVKILLNLIGTDVPVELSGWQIQKIKD